MRYLVTGGAGFIGSHLVRHLLERGPDTEVVSLDALTYAGHEENLEDVLDDPRHRFVHGDICDEGASRDALDGVDAVFHLAAESHVDRSIIADAPFVRTNVLGTATMLAAALDARVRRFVHVSTDEVYGELAWRDPERPYSSRDDDRFTEDSPLRPRSPYAASKAGSDHLALAYHATHGLDVVVTRCSNNYGPFQFPEKLIPVIVARASAGEPVPIYGDGLYVRDWIHVEDHCRGLIAAAKSGVAGRVYNFGGVSERTNLAVARAVLAELGLSESLIEHVEDRPGHDRRYAVSFERARAELDWEPHTPFEHGLRDAVAWYRENEAWARRVTEVAAERGR